MSLKRKTFELASFSLLDSAISKIFSVIIFAVVVRLLAKSDIGIIGVVGGYMTLFMLLAITPESILIKDFARMKDKLNGYVSAFFLFWAARMLALMLIAVCLAAALFLASGNLLLAIFLVGNVLAFNFGLFHGIITETFYVSFRQKLVTVVNALLMLVMLALLPLLLLMPNILTYLLILLLSASINCLVWLWLMRRSFSFIFSVPRNAAGILRKSIKDFALWLQLNSSLMNIIYHVDTLVLSFFVPLAIIGDYTVALVVANFFFVVPMIVQKSMAVSFSNIGEKERIETAVGIFLKYAFLLSIAQFTFFLIFGKFIVAFFSTTNIDTIYLHCLLITAGVSIINMARPFMAFITVKAELRKAFFSVFLPGTVAAVILYIILTALFGPVGTAFGNISGYAIIAILVTAFTVRECGLRPRFSIFSMQERELFNDFASKARGLFGRRNAAG